MHRSSQPATGAALPSRKARRAIRFGDAMLLPTRPRTAMRSSSPLRPLLLLLALQGSSQAVAPAILHAQRAPLSALEARIVAHVDAHVEEAIALLERTTNINSGTMNHRGVRRVADVLAPELRALGFETRWIPMDSVNRAGHLFAERRGNRGKKLLLIGHLDTVFEEDSPFQHFSREGPVARGPGVSDMKGGNVVIIQALKALHAAGALDGTTITVAFTGDEENPGEPLSYARRPLIEAGIRSDVALEFESGSRDAAGEYATIARRSATGWTLRVQGRTGHSSTIFGAGAGSGAIFEAARILDAFHEQLRGEQYLTFSPGVIVGGTQTEYDPEEERGHASGKSNVIAQTVTVTGDLRTLTPEQQASARERMRRIATSGHRPGTSATITFSEGYPPMPPTPGNRALLDRLSEVNRSLGLPEMRAFDPGRRGAADISFVAPYVDGLAGLGIHGSGAHTPEETADLASLPVVTRRAALLIHRLTR
jgi:glutamate carboxypeptidase